VSPERLVGGVTCPRLTRNSALAWVQCTFIVRRKFVEAPMWAQCTFWAWTLLSIGRREHSGSRKVRGCSCVGAVHTLGFFWVNGRVLRTLESGGSRVDVVHISSTDAARFGAVHICSSRKVRRGSRVGAMHILDIDAAPAWARCTFTVHGKFADAPVWARCTI
jgi:hypothetical protein